MYGDRRFANSISDENIAGIAECDDLKWNVGLVQPYSLLPLENEAMAWSSLNKVHKTEPRHLIKSLSI